MLDFAQIKRDHNIKDVAERLGLTLKKNGATYRCPCPSGEGNERGFVITPEKGVFYSFPKQKGGDCISLVAFVQGCDLKTAAAWITGDQNVPEKKKRVEPAEKEPEAKPSEGFKPLAYLQPDHPAVDALGFDPEFAKQHGIGYAPRGVMRGLVAIPVRDSKGRLMGYIGTVDARLPSTWRTYD